jgi:hypothetical protein
MQQIPRRRAPLIPSTDHGGAKRREVMAAPLQGRCSENFSRSVKSPVIVRSATATLPSFLCWRSLLPSLSCSGIVVLATGRVTPCPTMKENYLPIKQTPKDCYDRSRNASRIPVKSSPRSIMFGAVCWAGARSGRRSLNPDKLFKNTKSDPHHPRHTATIDGQWNERVSSGNGAAWSRMPRHSASELGAGSLYNLP